MLCQIHGISNSIADVVVEKYEHIFGCIQYLKEKYGEDYEGMSDEIGEMKYGKGGGRKIGIVSRNIISQLFGVTLSDKTKTKKTAKKVKDSTIDLSNVFSD